ncbi:hypothetical protein AURDEDRAFT_168097 [Auricularia subglabra TFB-10046 SS5]|nr:hypothetical protein AURDEDRAFT_168097 [Auricularia subglabra TFB-10046 SS5]
MSTSRSTQWYTLYSRLSGELHAALDGDSQETHIRRPGRLLELSSARDAVNAALGDVLEAWNIAHPDALLRLPTELVNAIFRLLELRSCIAVSHVSRGWRDTALADPFLWSAAKFAARLPVYYPRPGGGAREPLSTPARPRPPRDEILRELLARSDPVPFSLAWEDELLPAESLATVLCNIHRIEALEVDLSEHGFQQLFARPAPQLRSLICTSDSDTCELPARWDAPVLQTLELSTVRCPTDGEIAPLNTVKTLRFFDLDVLGQHGVRLFTVFPGLTSLYITIVTPEVMPYLGDPPATLTELTLNTDDPPPIDYAPLLDACRACALRLLNLESAQDLAPVLELFMATLAGTWTLRLKRRTGARISLKADEGGVAYKVVLAEPLSFPREARLASHLGRVSSLTANIEVFFKLFAFAAWDRRLPALRRLSLECTTTPKWPASALQPIRAPLLEHIAFSLDDSEADDAAQWLAEQFPAMLRSTFVYSRALLASITVESHGDLTMEGVQLSALRALAEVVRI